MWARRKPSAPLNPPGAWWTDRFGQRAIVGVNEDINDDIGIVNSDPHDTGWLVVIEDGRHGAAR